MIFCFNAARMMIAKGFLTPAEVDLLFQPARQDVTQADKLGISNYLANIRDLLHYDIALSKWEAERAKISEAA